VEVVSKGTDSKLVGFGVLPCWLQVSCKCARLECVRVPFVKVKQHDQILREIRHIPIRTVENLKLNQPIMMLYSLCLSDSVLSLL